jgi:hypothetical protein
MTDHDVTQAHREGRIGGSWYPDRPAPNLSCAHCGRGDLVIGPVLLFDPAEIPLHAVCAESYFSARSQ